jgi:hypothetical protein
MPGVGPVATVARRPAGLGRPGRPAARSHHPSPMMIITGPPGPAGAETETVAAVVAVTRGGHVHGHGPMMVPSHRDGHWHPARPYYVTSLKAWA